MIEQFRLLRQTARWCRYAAVTVEVVPAPASAVLVAQAIDGCWSECRTEAAAGAHAALDRLPAGGNGYRVTVTDIRVSNVDTGVGDVHEASTRAVWHALGVTPEPAYLGFSEPEVVAAWLRERIGRTVMAVTEARHWHGGERGQDAASLVHAWLHFEYGAPTMLHGCGDRLLLSTGDPSSGCDLGEYGDIRVGPATPPDHLASLVGRRLTNAALIIGPERTPTCAGLVLRSDNTDLVVGTVCDEWVLAIDQAPPWTEPYWRQQPWIA